MWAPSSPMKSQPGSWFIYPWLLCFFMKSRSCVITGNRRQMTSSQEAAVVIPASRHPNQYSQNRGQYNQLWSLGAKLQRLTRHRSRDKDLVLIHGSSVLIVWKVVQHPCLMVWAFADGFGSVPIWLVHRTRWDWKPWNHQWTIRWTVLSTRFSSWFNYWQAWTPWLSLCVCFLAQVHSWWYWRRKTLWQSANLVVARFFLLLLELFCQCLQRTMMSLSLHGLWLS